MTIEGGGRAGMIAPDETTFEWVRGRAAAPRRTSTPQSSAGASCRPTTGASFDTEVEIDAGGDLADGHLGDQPRAWSSR